MKLYKTTGFKIDVPGDKPWISIICKATPGFDDFRLGLLQALEHVKHDRRNLWLFDLRKIDALSEEEESWCQAQFFPQLMMLGQENYIAIVVSEKCYQGMLQEVGLYGLKSYNSFIIIDTFFHIPDAQDWLLSHYRSAVG